MKIRLAPSTPGARAGQSLTEFALIAPLLVVILIGIIELGIIFLVYTGLTNSAREGARAGAVYWAAQMPSNGDTAAHTQLDDERTVFLTQAITETLNPIIPADVITPTVIYLPTRDTVATRDVNPLRAGDTISVSLVYTHTLLWGIVGDQELVLRANAAARIEPGGAR
jgi:Flp pilus assembly protein TadG